MRLRTGLSLVLFLAALSAPGAAQLASLLKDIHTWESAGSSNPDFLGAVTGWTYFAADSPSVGRELWATDGSPENTHLVADACSGPCSSAYSTLAISGETLFLALSRHPYAGYQEELVVAKGSPPEFASIWTAAENIFLQQLSTPGATALLDDRLVFSSTADYSTFDLLATHAAGPGYELLHSFEMSGGLFGMSQLGSEILFWNRSGESSVELWATDGTPVGTRLIQPMSIEPQQLSIALADRWMLFVARDADGIELWRTDGSAAGTFPVTQFTDPEAHIWRIAATATNAFFFVEDVTFGQELWTTDGSAAGTHPVTAFGFHEPFGDNEYATHLAAGGSRAFFFATDGIAGVQIWSASASAGSASPIVEVCTEIYCFFETWLEVIGSQLFFLREDPNLGTEVWTSDGTAAGTWALRDACPGTCWGGGTVLATAVDKLVYAARESEVNQETVFVATAPWTGSQSLFDDVRGAPLLPYYTPTSCTVDDTRIYFGAQDSQGGSEPWVSVGSPASTLQLADIWGAADSSSGPHGFASNGATVAFLAYDDTFNESFWLTGGEDETTRPVASSAYSCIPWSGRIYPLGDKFAQVGCYGEIQVIDPASSQLEIIETGTGNCFASAASGALGGLLVAALGCDGGDQIWRSDGSPSGTAPTLILPPDFHVSWGFDRVADHLLGVGGSSVDRLYALSTNLSSLTAISPPGVIPDYRIVPDDEPLGFFTHLAQLWRTDGTAAGTFALGPAQQSLRLQAAVRSSSGYDLLMQADYARAEIWFSDGTVQGTTLRASVPLDYGSEATLPLERAGSLLYFVLPALEGQHLWVLEDGSFEPRRLQATTGAGINSQGSGLAHIAERAIFSGCDAAHGCDLWTSDGTLAGTRLLHDIAPGVSSSNPDGYFTVGSRLYLGADDGLHGRELWSLELDGGPPCRANAHTLCLESGRFQVTSKWRDFAGNTGYATAAPITGDTGYFWFFDEDNVELILKLIDGGGFNGHHWVYYGALSNVEYTFTVTDSETGAAKRYFNPAARFASSGDITAFGPQGAHAQGGPAGAMTRAATPPEISLAAFSAPQELPGTCVPTATRFCILDNRFAVTATWRDFAGHTGTANAGTLTDDTGYLWFFDEANVEVVLKMVDAGAFNGHFWVYYGALSNVEYTLTVTDTVSGGPPKIYRNALGQFGSFGDIEAFPAP